MFMFSTLSSHISLLVGKLPSHVRTACTQTPNLFLRGGRYLSSAVVLIILAQTFLRFYLYCSILLLFSLPLTTLFLYNGVGFEPLAKVCCSNTYLPNLSVAFIVRKIPPLPCLVWVALASNPPKLSWRCCN